MPALATLTVVWLEVRHRCRLANLIELRDPSAACGHATSYWEMGGIRLGAYSKGKRTRRRCGWA